MFEKLNNNELRQLFDQQYENKKIRHIVEHESGDDAKFMLREHAFALYWKRRFSSFKKLTDSDIYDIFSYSEFPVSKNILGDAARMGLLNQFQCCEILRRISEDEWAYKAIKARIFIFEIIADRTKKNNYIKLAEESRSNDDVVVAKSLDKLISLRMTWAILELIQYLKLEELNELRQKMENKSVLTRWNRHSVREEIDKILKSDAKI